MNDKQFKARDDTIGSQAFPVEREHFDRRWSSSAYRSTDAIKPVGDRSTRVFLALLANLNQKIPPAR